ncbi:MAG: hypothetical protein J0I69_02960 [Altererythrobacter sp.]|nr:hypothetical protein [Altererythrobacter sp.]OJU60971.1 MAG: hypothetical protein BGO08_12670 [Altererythrobacter sp. 66-12]
MNRRQFLAVPPGLALAAIATPAFARQHVAGDGYAFERREYFRSRLDLRIVEHASYRDLVNAMPNGGPPRQNRKVQAWSNLWPDGSAEIHIIDQSVNYTPAALGHELAHCIYGRWHA